MITLTDKERDRFACWLEQETESAKSIIEQIKKLNLGSPGQALIEKENVEAHTALLIANRLRTTHTETLENDY